MQTRVGYAGGRELNPTYRNIGGHAEAFRVIYDPDVVSFEELMGPFSLSGRPLGGYGQYRTALFPQDVEQLEVIERLMGRKSPSVRDGVVRWDRPDARFWDAEDYHQKYRLRRKKAFVSQLEQELGPRWDQYPLATKLNASVRGDVDPEPWLAQLPSASRAAWAA
ncbi:MAG: peptide-methionine (S)-S-oxide reductase [Deltaproteobacteria bacterium]|nr:peptide-methionine (S)-S-oxide reductase [Deltaproteobacteria bacterium]